MKYISLQLLHSFLELFQILSIKYRTSFVISVLNAKKGKKERKMTKRGFQWGRKFCGLDEQTKQSIKIRGKHGSFSILLSRLPAHWSA